MHCFSGCAGAFCVEDLVGKYFLPTSELSDEADFDRHSPGKRGQRLLLCVNFPDRGGLNRKIYHGFGHWLS